jgi:ubiquinone/menaquinone biosynthesis C-methylase UbiE
MIQIDLCHQDFIFGCARAKKPKNVLELGFGTGDTTMQLIEAIGTNCNDANFTVVDNLFDWQGKKPDKLQDYEKYFLDFKLSDEKTFVEQCSSDTYDFLVSDADHQSAHDRFEQLRRIVKHDGFMFFHDTNTPETYPILATFKERAEQYGLPCFHFTESSRSDEKCERGLLFVINKK